MKKIEYQAPEMEVIELKMHQALLTMSDTEVPGTGDHDDL